MPNSRTAQRYALALADLASEQKAHAHILKDVSTLEDLCKRSRELLLFLRSPLVRPLKKAHILNKILKQSVSDETLNFVELLVHKNRIALLPEICAAYRTQHYERVGCIEAKLLSAYPMREAEQQKIARWIEKKLKRKPIFHSKTDAELLGGYVVQMDELRLDRSVRGQLKHLRHSLAAQKQP